MGKTELADTFDRIAEFVFTAEPDIPDPVKDYASLLLVDTIGIAAGAARMESGILARDFAADFMGAGDEKHAAPIMFDGRMASMMGAAFAAATQIDNLDGHDGYNPTKGHIGCAVVPALLAFGHHLPNLTGRQALEAMVIAYEVAARAAIALHDTVSDYHTSGAWNGLGVAAMGCRLMGATPDQLRHALGIAEYHGPRSQMMREIDNPTMLHDGSGMGALVGVKACMLAVRGFTGAPALTIESKEVARHWDDLGSLWTTELNYIKPYPICRWAHAPIDATRKIMQEHNVTAEGIARIEVSTFHESSRLYAGMPETTSQAQYSLKFAVATMLRFGTIGPEQITGEALKDRDTASVMERIVVREDERHNARFPIGRWADVTVTLEDGRVLQSGDVHARGGPEAPMEVSEVKAKFMQMAKQAVSDQRAKQIWETGVGMNIPAVLFKELSGLTTMKGSLL